MNINKQEAKKELAKLQEQVDKLNSIINKPENICDKIQDLDSVYEILEIEENDFLPFKSNTKDKFQKKMNNIARLLKVEEAYSENWIPDWNNTNEYKYYPYYYKESSSSSSSHSACSYFTGSLAYFQTSVKSLDAGKKFKSLYDSIRE